MTPETDVRRHYEAPVVLSWPELIDQWETSRGHVAYDPSWGRPRLTRIIEFIRRVVR